MENTIPARGDLAVFRYPPDRHQASIQHRDGRYFGFVSFDDVIGKPVLS